MHLAYISLLLAQFTCLLASTVAPMANPTTAGDVVDLAKTSHEHDTLSEPPAQSSDSILESQQPPTLQYMVTPKDDTDDAMSKEVDTFLRTQTTSPEAIKIYKLPGTDHIVSWGNVLLTKERANNVSFA